MAANQAMKLSVLIGADAAGLGVGGAEAEAALNKVKTAANDAGKSVQQLIVSQEGLGKAAAAASLPADNLKAYGAQLDALRAKYNPVYAAIRQYKTEVSGIKQAHEAGALSVNEMTAAIDRERRATLASIDAIKGRKAALADTGIAGGTDAGTAFRRQNLGYQAFDIGQGVASGMPLPLILAQQGPQIAQMYAGQGGLKAALSDVGAIAGGVATALGPIGLSIAAIGAAAGAYFLLTRNETKSTDEILAQHAQNIRDIKEAYGDAASGLKEYVTESRTVLLANASSTLKEAQAVVKDAAQDAYRTATQLPVEDFAGPIDTLHAFGVAIENLRKSIASGQPDILSYREALSNISTDDSASQSQRDLADRLRAIDEEAIRAARSLPAAATAISVLNGASQRGFLVNDQKAQQDYSDGLTAAYLREQAAIDKIYQAGVTTRGFMATSAQQQLAYEDALTEAYQRQQKQIDDIYKRGVTSRGFIVTNAQQLLEYEASLNDVYTRRQAILDTLQAAQTTFAAQQLQAAARTPQEKATAARDVAAATVISGEDPDVRTQRIVLAGKTAQLNAERDLARAQEDRIRSADSAVATAQNELAIAGQSVEVRARLRAEFAAELQYREAIARTGGTFNQAELDALKQKAALLATINAQVSAQQAVQSQNDDIARLRLETQLVGASADVRAKSLAAFEAEQKIRDLGIATASKEADALRAGAQARAEMQVQLERQQAAYQSLQQAEGSAIDTLVTGTGSMKDSLKQAASQALQWFQQIAVANPLKNALTGTNLPTLSDLFSGKTATTAATTSTAAMTVTAGTVMINGVPLGTPGAGVLGSVLGANNNQPPAANVNGVRPDLLTGGLVNSPVGAQAALTSGTDVQSQVWNYWAAKGLQPHQIAGIMGNMQAESAFRPGAIGDNGNALGLSQWNDRGPAMQAYVGPGWQTNVQGQLDFMNHEFQTSENASWQKLMASKDVNSATQAMAGYERPRGYSPANPMGADNYAGRIEAANASMAKFGQTTTAATANVSSMSTGALDASKSLAQGDNSLVGSITKASQTAAQPAAGGSALSGAASGGQNVFGSLFGAIGSITKGIGSMISGLVSSLGSVISKIASGAGDFISSIFGAFANGGAFSNGNVMAFADGGAFTGRIIDRPTLFPMAGGRTGLMGEDGPEGILPLKRGSDGKLGVRASMPRQVREGGGAMSVHLSSSIDLNVYGNGDAELKAQQEESIRQAIEQNNKAWADQLPDMIDAWQRDPYARSRTA